MELNGVCDGENGDRSTSDESVSFRASTLVEFDLVGGRKLRLSDNPSWCGFDCVNSWFRKVKLLLEVGHALDIPLVVGVTIINGKLLLWDEMIGGWL